LVEAFKEDLPKEVYDRGKQGFGFPFENWFKENKYLNNTALLPSKWKNEFLNGKVKFSRVWAVFLSRCFFQDLQLEIENPKRVPKILFTYLCAFSETGGIEKVNKAILKLLKENNELSEAISLYDNSIDTRYFNRFRFTGYNKRKVAYLTHFITCDLPWEKVIIGHINLLPVVWIIKKRNPKIKVILMVHGIEVWHSLSKFNKEILLMVDQVISVSNYTKQKLIELNGVSPEKIIVKPNCLDPFFIRTEQFSKPSYLLKKYGLIGDEKIVLSISRISIQDRYKGYVSVINAIAKVKLEIPKVLFLICGKSTKTEKEYLEGLVENAGIKENVKLVGYLQDDEIQDHYLLADVFALPSRKEGFGIVFIEAAANGVHVIAGNEDASKEALLNGKMGTTLNPDDITAIAEAIKDAFVESDQKPRFRDLAYSVYNFSNYKKDFPF
jgi:glycosyltransferase involved in cell wall biosynthesis